jgi:SAM-dependent methyltransferase
MRNQAPVTRAVVRSDRNLQRQIEEHPLIEAESFNSIGTYVLHLIHLRAYEEAARLVEGKTVLDLGCNLGYGLKVLAARANSAAGVDVSPHAVEAAKERLGSIADIRLYDGTLCSFAAESFDVITSFQVIEHISNYPAYFSEITRLLRPGGMVLFTTPNASLRLDPGMKPWNPFHVREFSAPDLRKSLSTWFDVVEVSGLFATDELYRIERERCEREKIGARSRTKRIRSDLRQAVKRSFPWLVDVRNSVIRRPDRNVEQPTIPESEMVRFSTRDLFYKTDELEDALDLMAVCRVPTARAPR